MATKLFVVLYLFVATSIFAFLNDPLANVVDMKIVTEGGVKTSEKPIIPAARHESLIERAKNLREVATDLAESARLLADRTDILTFRTELLVEERSNQREEDTERTTVVRLRKNKAPKLKGDCNVDTCSSVCVVDCKYLCGSTVFVRPEECDLPNFCSSRCSDGCKEDACEFRFDFNLPGLNAPVR